MNPSAADQRPLSAPLAFGPFVLRPDLQRLTRDAQPLALKPKVYDLLCLLLQHRHRVLSRAEILDWLWPRQDIGDATLSQAVYELRQALGEPGWIESVPRRGYRFAGEVQAVAGRTGAAPSTIAVLPLRLLAPSTDQDWLGLALADGLISALSQRATGRMVVRALGAVLPLADRPGSLADKAALLQVDAVVEGTVLPGPQTLTASLRVVRVADQAVLGATTLQGDAQALLAGRDTLAGWVLAVLGLVSQARPAAPAPLSAVEALFIKARACWHRFDVPAWRQAVAYLDAALALQAEEAPEDTPASARLLALRADCWSAMASLGGIAPKEGFARCLADAQRAVALAPGRPEGHASMAAYHLFHDWQPGLALKAVDCAIEADPDSAGARHLRALALSAARHVDAALAEIERARRLDPASLLLHNDQAAILHHGGRPGEAIAVFDAVLDRDPAFAHAHWHKALALADLGEAERGLASLATAFRLSARDPATSGQWARLLQLAGRENAYREQRAAVLAAVRAGQADPMEAVWALLADSDPDASAAWLAQAIEARSREVILVGHLPALAGLKRHPRIAALLSG